MRYLFALAAALTVSCAASVRAYGQGNYVQSAYAHHTFAPVALPLLPSALDFAGERVPLQNYDTRESLMRELLVNSYMQSRTMLTLLNTERYFSIIEPILARNGIPADFRYLCVAESGLNTEVVSTAKAAGLWQLMPATGRDHGLEVGPEVDERFHIEKSTEVACRHLLRSYEKFGSWTLAAAAYNLGDAGVARRLEIQGLDNYYDAFMPDETRRYVFRILAFKLLYEDPARFGYMIRKDQYYKPLTDYREVTVSDRDIDWSTFAAQHGTTYRMIRELNHWIRDYRFANKDGKSFVVKIPGAGFRTQNQ